MTNFKNTSVYPGDLLIASSSKHVWSIDGTWQMFFVGDLFLCVGRIKHVNYTEIYLMNNSAVFAFYDDDLLGLKKVPEE